jgi:5-methylcytosine-specific restriction enzyme A
MISGNAAIRDHSSDGKDLLVFSQIRKGGQVRFEGLFVCVGWETERQPDINGNKRDAIVFSLIPLHETEFEGDALAKETAPVAALSELRARAMAAATPAQGMLTTSVTTLFRRARDVRDYVLARAEGRCEACRAEAPFKTVNGRPYLEAHHIRRLSDGGPDDPCYVAGICPNCHRRAHFGGDRDSFNADLLDKIERIERS